MATARSRTADSLAVANDAGTAEALLYGLTMTMAAAPVDQFIQQGMLTDAHRAVGWAAIYGGYFLLVLSRPQVLGQALADTWPLLTVPLLGLLSTSWSAAPQDTVVASLQVAAVVVFGAIMGLRLDESHLLAMLIAVGTILAVADLVVLISSPIAIDINGNAAGIFINKNTNGQIMVTLLIAAGAVLGWGGPRWWAVVIVALGTPQVLLSGSRTSWAMALAAMATFVLLTLRRMTAAGRVTTVFLGATAICCAGILWLTHPIDLETLALKVADKDATFTGRTVLWQLAQHYIDQSPFLGSGFGAFWSQGITSDSAFVQRVLGEDLPHFHNTYLEMAVELGWVGTSLAVVVGLAFLLPIRRLFQFGDAAAASFACALLAALAVGSVSEVVLFTRHGFHLLLIAALWSRATLLSREARLTVEAVPE